MTEIAVAHRESTTPDGVLVQQAAAGSGVSYGELYDRHAEHVYNYCLRVTGSPEDAADATQEAFLNVLRRLQEDDRPVLDFSSYLFAAARNESYALMRRRSRVQVSDSPPEDPARTADVATEPERAVLRRDSQEAVRAANAKLPPRHREVLALRELGGRSYDEIGRIMGISENGAAQLIWRARSKMREAMTAGAVASVVATSTECERAQLLLSRIQDGEPVLDVEREWLDRHLDECGSCRSAKGMLLEVGAFYAAWVPVAAIAGLKAETLTAAGGIIGADWSGVASGGGSAGGGGGAIGGGAIAAAGAVAAVGAALAALLGGGESQLDRNVREQMEQPPAASEPAPDAKKTEAAKAAADTPAAAAGAEMAAQRALRAAPDTGPGGEVRGFTQDRPRGGEPRGNGPDGEGPRGGPRDTTPGPLAPGPREDPGPPGGGPGPPDTNPGPPRDIGPPNPPKPDPPRGGPPPDSTPTDPPGPPPPPPPPPESSSCTWPGGGGGGIGCPPGHGGVPPGHGGEPPGQFGKP